jgi:hypothetical protein
LAEQLTLNQWVTGSSPVWVIFLFKGYSMNMRERILAVLNGQPVDKIPFVLYEGIFPTSDLIDVLGMGKFGLMKWSEIHKSIYPNCKIETNDYWIGESHWQRSTIHTPIGSIYEERLFEPVLNSSSIRKHYIETKNDYETLWFFLKDAILLPDYDRYDQDQAELGEFGLPLVAVERTPYQQLWIIWTGLDQLAYHWIDFPDYVERTIELLTERERKIFELSYYSPAQFIDFPDNITAPAIGPKRFEKYCVPLYDELAGMLEEKNKLVFVHMDGDLKPLWKLITRSKIGGLDSFSPSPDNDTTVQEAVALWPGKKLFINFPSSIHLQDKEKIQEMTRSILEAAGHTGRLQIQISENVPPFRWKESLPKIVEEIESFGAP